MGWLPDFIEKPLEEFADAVVDVVEGAVNLAEDALEAIGGIGGDVLDAAADVTGGALEAIGSVVSDAGGGMLDLGEAMLTVMDDVVFDTVDFATAGLIDVDYDDGVFGADLGIDGVFGVSMTLSEEGFSYSYETVVASFEIAYGAEGFSTGVSAGVDWGPLPYVEGHVSVDENGNVGVGGQVQAYLPTPAGLSGGELVGDYQQTDEGFRVSGSVTGGNYAYTGTYAKGGVHSSYEEDAQGYRFQVGLHGEVGQVGVGSVSSSVDYVEGRRGDVSYEGVGVTADADGFGASVEVAASYTHLETEEGEVDVVRGEVSGTVAGNTVSASGGVVDGPGGTTAFGEVTHDVDELGLAKSGLAAAGQAAGIGGPGDLGLPDVGPVGDALEDKATEAFGDALGVSGGAGRSERSETPEEFLVTTVSTTVEETIVEEVVAEAPAEGTDDLG